MPKPGEEVRHRIDYDAVLQIARSRAELDRTLKAKPRVNSKSAPEASAMLCTNAQLIRSGREGSYTWEIVGIQREVALTRMLLDQGETGLFKFHRPSFCPTPPHFTPGHVMRFSASV